MSKLHINDLPKEIVDRIKKDNGLSTRNQSMSKEEVKTHAIAVLNTIKDLDKNQRDRVFKLAIRMNKV